MRNHPRRTLVATATAALILPLAGLVPGTAAVAKESTRNTTVDIQILNVSDFHGQLDPLNIFGVGDVGGAAALSTYWQQDRAANPNTLLLTGGDAVGASPPLSSFFGDKPTIDFMNYAGFDADTFGNHNFDKGLGHLQDQIDLADFDYVSSNLDNLEDNLSGVTSPFAITKVGGVKVAIIGVTNPEAPSLVSPGNLGTLEITDPAEAAMNARAEAAAQDAKVFIAVGHLGIEGKDALGAPTGRLIDFASQVDGFDLILGDHTDVQYKNVINGALVIENRSKGATYARTNLHYDRRNGGSVTATSTFVVPFSNAVTPDPKVVSLLQPYREELSEKLDGVIGVATDIFPRDGNERLREVAIGDLVADTLRETYGTQIAFTNGGGLRTSLPSSSYLPQDTTLRRPSAGYAAGPPYDVVTGDAYAVLPFGNQSLTRTVTGAQLWAVLERSVSKAPNASGGFLQISGFRYTYDSSLPAFSRVVSVTLDDGTPVLPDATTYTATTNDFTNGGGDGYVELKDGQGATRNLMAGDLVDYIKAKGTITPATDGRIDDLNRPDA